MLKNTNISHKERHVFTMNDLRGVDLSSSPFDVSPNRAVDMKNLIKENGVTQKRKGWRQVYKLGDSPILGMYRYKNKDFNQLIVVTSKTVYVDSTKRYFFEKDATSAQFFNNKGMCYILTGSEFLECGIFDEPVGCEIRRVVEGQPYVPTTSISSGIDKIETFESANLLTAKRKNEIDFRGAGDYKLDSVPIVDLTNTETYECKIKYNSSENEELVDFTPDSTQKIGKDLEENWVEKEGVYYHQIHALADISGSYTNIDGEEKPVFFVYDEKRQTILLCIEGKQIQVEETLDFWEAIYGYGPIGTITIGDTEAIVHLYFDALDIFIEFTPKGYVARSELVEECTIGTLFGAGGNNDRIFISGNSVEPNLICYSEFEDFTYFPDNNRFAAGSSETSITGFSRLSDNTLAVLKQRNNIESTIYYVTGEFKLNTDDEGYTKKSDAIFRISSGGIGEGGVSNSANCNFNGESIVLSEGGVYGITIPSGGLVTNVRNVKERSYSIAAELRRKDLSGAVATVHDNRYYLCVDGKCYVADADYKYYREDDSDESHNYEWWVWDNVPATAIESIDGELVFGTKDGRICVFDEEYTDRQWEAYSGGRITVNDGYAVFSEDVVALISDKSRVRLRDEVLGCIGKLIGINDGFYIDEGCLSRIYVGMQVTVDTYKDTYKISYIDRGECKVKLTKKDNSEELILDGETVNIYISLKDMDLSVEEDVDENGKKIFWFLRPGTSERINIKAGSWYGLYVTEYSPIIAEWKTPYLDMGTNMYGKTIHSFTVTCESDNGNVLNVGYQTCKSRGSVEARSPGSFSFDNFSFKHLTFENGFASNHTIRRTVRDFNYIQFKFMSDVPSRCALHGLSAIYKINKMNKGVK